MQSNFY